MAKSMRIRTDDRVVVRSGKDAGKSGRVVRTDPKRQFVFVEHLSMIKRHERPRNVQDATRGGDVGGIVEKEGPIHVSNVMLLDPKDNKPVLESRYSRTKKIGETVYLGYGFENAWEIVPGKWTFEVWYQGKKLATQSFAVTK